MEPDRSSDEPQDRHRRALPVHGSRLSVPARSSLDGASYFTLSDKRDNTTGGDAITVSFAAQSARFVRITVVGASGYTAGWTAIDEMQIYEAP